MNEEILLELNRKKIYYKELKKVLNVTEISGYIYYGKRLIMHEKIEKICYVFVVLISNKDNYQIVTNRKNIQKQIHNYLKKRMKENE